MACLWFPLRQILALDPSRQVRLKEMMLAKTREAGTLAPQGAGGREPTAPPFSLRSLAQERAVLPWKCAPFLPHLPVMPRVG